MFKAMAVEKKTRASIPKVNKVRAELQKEIGSLCPFCDTTEVGHFEIHHIDENPSNNDQGNLLLLCPICHSKITKGDIPQIEVFKKKIALIQYPLINKSSTGKVTTFNGTVHTPILGDNNTISIKNVRKATKQKYPEGSLGYDTIKANYISHLIGRYNEYKEYEVGKGKLSYGVFPSHLKKQYKIGPTRTLYNLPVEKFEELAVYIQSRINATKLAKIKGKAHKNYSSFEEYEAIQK